MTAYSQRPDRLALMTQLTANATGRRFCAHHQGEVPATGGDFVVRNKSRRWICYHCQERGRHRYDVLEHLPE